MAQTIFIGVGPKERIPTFIMKKFDFIQMLEAIQKYKITTLRMVPPIVVVRILPSSKLALKLTKQMLAKSPHTKKYDLSSVIDLGSGAAPLGGDVIKEAEALWPEGDRKIRQGWGVSLFISTLSCCIY